MIDHTPITPTEIHAILGSDIHATELLIVKPLPNHCDSRRRADHREEEDRSEYRNSFNFAVQKNCKKQSDHYT